MSANNNSSNGSSPEFQFLPQPYAWYDGNNQYYAWLNGLSIGSAAVNYSLTPKKGSEESHQFNLGISWCSSPNSGSQGSPSQITQYLGEIDNEGNVTWQSNSSGNNITGNNPNFVQNVDAEPVLFFNEKTSNYDLFYNGNYLSSSQGNFLSWSSVSDFSQLTDITPNANAIKPIEIEDTPACQAPQFLQKQNYLIFPCLNQNNEVYLAWYDPTTLTKKGSSTCPNNPLFIPFSNPYIICDTDQNGDDIVHVYATNKLGICYFSFNFTQKQWSGVTQDTSFLGVTSFSVLKIDNGSILFACTYSNIIAEIADPISDTFNEMLNEIVDNTVEDSSDEESDETDAELIPNISNQGIEIVYRNSLSPTEKTTHLYSIAIPNINNSTQQPLPMVQTITSNLAAWPDFNSEGEAKFVKALSPTLYQDQNGIIHLATFIEYEGLQDPKTGNKGQGNVRYVGYTSFNGPNTNNNG